MKLLIGANPGLNNQNTEFANMILKEAMVYDRALTEEEIKTITESFKKIINNYA